MTTSLRLHSFGGRPPPKDVLWGMKKLLAFPAKAIEDFWAALGPCLSEQLSTGADQMLEHFARAHDVEGTDVARAVRAARVLLRAASSENLPAEVFEADLRELGADDPLVDVMCGRYEEAKAIIQGEIAAKVIAAHGKVLERFSWRMDIIAGADAAASMTVPVGVVTLHLREQDKRKQVTFQLSPEMIRDLGAACARMLSGPSVARPKSKDGK